MVNGYMARCPADLALLQDMQVKQDREIKSLGAADFTKSEALHWKETRANTKYMYVYVAHLSWHAWTLMGVMDLMDYIPFPPSSLAQMGLFHRHQRLPAEGEAGH